MPAPRSALRLSRILDRRQPEDGLQGTFSRARAPGGGGVEDVCPSVHLDIVGQRAPSSKCRWVYLIPRFSPTCLAPRQCAAFSATKRFSHAASRSRRLWRVLTAGSA